MAHGLKPIDQHRPLLFGSTGHNTYGIGDSDERKPSVALRLTSSGSPSAPSDPVPLAHCDRVLPRQAIVIRMGRNGCDVRLAEPGPTGWGMPETERTYCGAWREAWLVRFAGDPLPI